MTWPFRTRARLAAVEAELATVKAKLAEVERQVFALPVRPLATGARTQKPPEDRQVGAGRMKPPQA